MATGKHGLKVLEVASSLYEWGGIERYVHFVDVGLSHRGHKVTVVCPPKSPLAERTKHPECLFANRGKFSVRTYLGFRRIGRAIKPDIAHIHFSPDFVLPALALRQTSRAKIVLTRHLVLPWTPAKVKQYLALFDHIIPVSGAVEKRLLESGIPPDRMTVARAGVPSVEEVPESGETEGELLVGCFGRLVREKGVDVLIQAASRVPTMRVEIYGEGPERESLQSLTLSLNVADRVLFNGHVSDVLQAMRQCDAIAVPSVWDEAFPYSILEAMAVGKAVVASAVGGIPEVVEDGLTGRLFPRGDVDSLAEVLSELAGNREAVRKMGRAGRLRQSEEYTIPKMAERIESVFRQVLAKTHP